VDFSKADPQELGSQLLAMHEREPNKELSEIADRLASVPINPHRRSFAISHRHKDNGKHSKNGSRLVP